MTAVIHRAIALAGALLLTACSHATNPAVTSTVTVTPSAAGPSGAPSVTAPVTVVPAQNCGVNLSADAVVKAAGSLPPESHGWKWDTKPFAGNYNPCATLSVAIVSIERGTGSSPRTAMMFHRGEYLGTATLEPRGFTRFDDQRTTDDTVVLDYDTPGECTACAPAATDPVRFQWQGDHVVMLDPMPTQGEENQSTSGKYVTPSGNIMCDVVSNGANGTAVCEIRDHAWAAKQCPQGGGDRFILEQGKPVDIRCHTDTGFVPGLPTLPYTHHLVAGAINCDNQPTGMTCTDSTTGHSFRLSKESFSVG